MNHSKLNYVPLKAVMKYIDFDHRAPLVRRLRSNRSLLRRTPYSFRDVYMDRPNSREYIIKIDNQNAYYIKKSRRTGRIVMQMAGRRGLKKAVKTMERDLGKLIGRFIKYYFERKETILWKLLVKTSVHPTLFPMHSENLTLKNLHLDLCITTEFSSSFFKNLTNVHIDLLDAQVYCSNERILKRMNTLENVDELVLKNLDLPGEALLTHLDYARFKVFNLNEMNGDWQFFVLHCKNLTLAQFVGSKYTAYLRNFRGCFSVLLSRIRPQIRNAKRRKYLLGKERDCIRLASCQEHLEVNIYVDEDMMRPFVAEVMLAGSATNTLEDVVANDLLNVTI